MNALPYRAPMHGAIPCEEGCSRVDADLLFAAALFWVVSLIRVVGAFARHETFGAEATLALIAVLCTPGLLLRRSRRAPALGTKEMRAS
jgi:hypothetical protein